jgi:hypothetical protein
MGRVSDYIRFATWLLGVGYIALWPFISHDDGGPIGTSFICPSFLAFLCHFPRLLALPPGLHWIGFFSAGWVCLELVLHLIAQLKRGRARRSRAALALSARIPATVLRTPRQKPLHPSRRVKPRGQFGLRGRPE